MLLRTCFLMLTIGCNIGFAASDSGAAQELAALLAETRTMQAEFEQRVTSDDGELMEESAGSMAFQRPHQLRWEISEPYRYLVLTDGQTLWRYDPDFEQLSTESFTSVAQTPMLILAASAEELSDRYEVRAQEEGADRRFSLEPRSNSPEFTNLSLVFAGQRLTHMRLTDKLGQQTEISLAEVNINGAALPDALFVFERAEAGKDQ